LKTAKRYGTFEAVKELADKIEAPPYLWSESQLWRAYAALETSKVKGAGAPRILTGLVSLVCFAIHQDDELVPFPERVNANFKAWLHSLPRPPGEGLGVREDFPRTTPLAGNDPRPHRRQSRHRAGRFRIRPLRPGGLGKVVQLFGAELNSLIEQVNESLAA
jgi:type I restriction enzyme R subunit